MFVVVLLVVLFVARTMVIVARVSASVGFAVTVVDVTGECVEDIAGVFVEGVADLMLDILVETMQKAVNVFGLSIDAAKVLHLGKHYFFEREGRLIFVLFQIANRGFSRGNDPIVGVRQ